jgi:ribonucleoside-triphosphate reductase
MSLPSVYQNYIHQSRYARFIDEVGRRETWPETVDRTINFFKKKFPNKKQIPWDELRSAILNLEVLPSMRVLMTAGEALERDNVAAFNCSYLPIDSPRSLDELMYILMCGTGVGYSVESRYVNKLPEVPEEFHDTDTVIVYHDSKIGWAKGFREFMSLLWSGQIPKWDTSKLRAAGERLKTFGGRASGPEPLIDLMQFAINTFAKAKGRKLTTLEVHDLVCKIADIVVCGGVRRSALICLCDLNDDLLRHAKSGKWWEENPQRALANISAVYEQKPDMGTFMREWTALYESKSGERGVFSRKASVAQAVKVGRKENVEYGTNPCSEIILRPYQFCNLTETIIRATDTKEDLARKVRLATILGTLQSSLSDFRYLRKIWKDNTEEECLLGVSMTGIYDHPVLNKESTENAELQLFLNQVAKETNAEFAKIIGVNVSMSRTCVKPAGTVSQLTDTASGIHARYARYYIRRVRSDKKDPLANFMISMGYEAEEDFYGKSNYVFSFPQKAPVGAVCSADVSAIDQLRLWKLFQDFWCDHKPSVTINVGEDEWLEVAAWLYKNIDNVSGVSFLPRDTGTYRQAPYEEITKEQYEELMAQEFRHIEIDWTLFKEETDTTEGVQTLACSSGVCEI